MASKLRRGSVRVQWSGLQEYINDVETMNIKSPKLQEDFLKVVEQVVLKILRDHSPSTRLGESWKVVARGSKYTEIDTDLQELFFSIVNSTRPHEIIAGTKGPAKALHYLVGGQDFFSVRVFHPGTRGNPFIVPILKALDQILTVLMKSLMAKHYKVFKHINIGGRRHGIGNIARTVGLTGTKVSRNRGRGKISLVRQRTGRRQFKRRLGRRRRSGRFIARKDMNVG